MPGSSGLSISGKDIKALYRRSKAYQSLGDVERSYTDAVAVKRIQPGNEAVDDVFVSCVHSFVRGSEGNYAFLAIITK